MGWWRFLFRRNRFIQVNPCSSFTPPCPQTGREFLFRNGHCWISHPVAVLFSARHMASEDQSLERTRSGNGRSKVRRGGHQGPEFPKGVFISSKAWHNEAGVSVASVIVLGCLLCCSDQWGEAGERLGNL